MKKLYVLVRNDISLAYQGVQAGHALAEWLLDNKDTQEWNNHTLVYLGVDSVEKWMYKLRALDIPYSYFVEPDIGNEVTALATYDDGFVFKDLKLMGS